MESRKAGGVQCSNATQFSNDVKIVILVLS
jgi:hypothetical protein